MVLASDRDHPPCGGSDQPTRRSDLPRSAWDFDPAFHGGAPVGGGPDDTPAAIGLVARPVGESFAEDPLPFDR